MRYRMILPMILALGFLGAADSAVAGEPREPRIHCHRECVQQCPVCQPVCDHWCKDSRTGVEFCCASHCKPGTSRSKCCRYENVCD